MLNNQPQMQLKLHQKKAIQKIAEAAGDLIGNKIADKITNVSRTSPQNTLGTVTNEHTVSDIKTPKERYIYPEKKKKILMI